MGLRGSGKSTVGAVLARRLGRPFVDLDALTLRRLGAATVRAVWQEHGEETWRAAEAETLDETLQADGQVVALGGGTPMIEAARALIEDLRREGQVWVVYLQCPVPELTRRLRDSSRDRPSLRGADPVEEIAQVLSEREPTYLALADLVCDGTAGPAEQIAEQLGMEAPGQAG